MATAADKFAEIGERLREGADSRVAGLRAVFQFDLAGPEGGVWHVAVEDGAGTLAEGPAQLPGVTIQMSAEDFVALTEGRLDATTAFMSGRLRVRGDMGLAMKLQSLVS